MIDLNKKSKCPCCSGKFFSVCCSPFLSTEKFPETAVQLMRSRYTAYSLANINYIQQTMCGPAAENFVPEEAKQWAEQVIWRGLKIIDSGKQRKDIDYDEVEFAAKYVAGNLLYTLQERSQFKKIDNRWFYITGTLVPHQPVPLKSI